MILILQIFMYIIIIKIILEQTPEIGQGLERILSCGAVNQNRLRWTYDYCGLRTSTPFHDTLILTVVSRLRKTITAAVGFEATDIGVCGQRSTSYTTADCDL